MLEQITINQVYNLKARFNQNMLGNVKVNLMEFIILIIICSAATARLLQE